MSDHITPADIPAGIRALLDDLAGQVHSDEGQVVSGLAQILTEWEMHRRARAPRPAGDGLDLDAVSRVNAADFEAALKLESVEEMRLALGGISGRIEGVIREARRLVALAETARQGGYEDGRHDEGMERYVDAQKHAAAVAALRAERDRLAAQVAAVRALHVRLECVNAGCAEGAWCGGCDPQNLLTCDEAPWPCATLKALDAPVPLAPEVCDQCQGLGWVRIKGKVTGALGFYETVTECMACNPDGRIAWAGQIEFTDEEQSLVPEARTEKLPPVNGCRHCGVLRHEHGQRWTEGVGWHTWAAPSDGERLGRMRAQRAARAEMNRSSVNLGAADAAVVEPRPSPSPVSPTEHGGTGE